MRTYRMKRVFVILAALLPWYSSGWSRGSEGVRIVALIRPRCFPRPRRANRCGRLHG